tara:strand:+ start:14307 stop:14582 length:276 start_codon:yes stop_codon:yes gene_type:complete
MIARLGIFAQALGRSITILACTLVYGPLYVVGLASRPTGRQMLSSYVGEAQANGHRWARIVAWIIDTTAVQFGDKPDHCRRAYLHYRALDD